MLNVVFLSSTPSSVLPEWEQMPLYIMTKTNLFELFPCVGILFRVSQDKMSEPAHPVCSALSEL